MAILRSFEDYPAEAALIGRMLAGYTDIEVDLMNCVKSVRQDLDTVFKAMYRTRGETARIEIADSFGRQFYHGLQLGTEFEMALGAVRHCLKIRNLFAHASIWNDNSGTLAIANLETLAYENRRIDDLHTMTVHHLNVPVLTSQFDYFNYTSDLLVWVLNEGNGRANRPQLPEMERPQWQRPKPALYVEE